ncbi:N-acetylglucosamine kinase [Prauserella muralis]|uniref:N-acetylglucosamine kinase n=1 Tax=Prauserella muralis TaxID=588067 RepID=A0A2V4BPU4_9PSEU|nr:N-acetylglucosamine kinase [Prauserella muralis]
MVVGVDAGGTASRALAVAADGRVLGTGGAGGGNPNSHPPERAAAAIAEAIAGALTGLAPASVLACVVGMAGTSKLTDPAVAAEFERAWGRLGLGARPRPVSDAEAAFASATAEPDGTVVVAGTGSIAARIRKRHLASVAGGYGWLLGDEGSGFWIGRQAVRTTLDALYGSGDLGPLGRAVLAEAGVGPAAPGAAHRLITAANAEPPVRLARFAPLVSAAADDGDPVAGRIIEQAADALTRLALATREPGEHTPVVLAGSVLGEASPVGTLVRERLSGLPVLLSADGVLGAAWLAAVDAFGEHAPRPDRVP